MDGSKERIALRAARNTIIANALLALFKCVAGVVGHSAAMLSDAVHSLSDVVSTGVVMVGIRMAGKEADADHPYGHERFESVAAILLAAMLCATGIGIGYGGLSAIVAGQEGELAVPGVIALVAAAASIAVKEVMYWYTRAAAKKIASDALMADAWHHRSDALSSVGSLAGVAGARMGFPVMDSVAALIICVFIIKASYDIFREAVSKITDRSIHESKLERLRELILSHGEVKRVVEVRTRLFGDKVCVDLVIAVDGDMTLREAHRIAHEVHDRIEARYGRVKHCMVHVNPDDGPPRGESGSGISFGTADADAPPR